MKIAVLSTYIENYVEEASFKIRFLSAEKMAEKGHDVILIYPANDSRRLVSKNVKSNLKVFSTPGLLPKRLRVGGFSLLDAIYKTVVILNSDVDVIEVIDGHRPAQFVPCFIGKYLKRAVIVDECWEWFGKGGYADQRKGFIGKLISFYDRCFELKLRGFYDHIITISTALKDRFKKRQDITVLHGGALNGLLRDYEIEDARKEVNLDSNLFIVGMSNVTPSDHEDNDVFFRSFESLCQQYNNLFLLTTGPNKYYIDEIKHKYSFPDKIIFPGWVEFDAYNKYLSSCNIFVLPYRNTRINAGRWPNKIGDYLCLNRAVVTNPTGDIKDLFMQYKVGLLCDGTPEGFYCALRKILNKEIDLTFYTKDSLYLAHEILSFDGRIEKIVEIFGQLTKKVRYQA